MQEYIQKYGENAIQAYKKSLRVSESLSKQKISPQKQQPHLIPKKNLSKKSLKSSFIKKNQSLTKSIQSKSIKNTSIIQQEHRKKGSSFNNNYKKILNTKTVGNGLSQDFSKLNLNQHKKKLQIIQSNSKCSTPKMPLNLNFHKQPQIHKPSTFNEQQKDKLTERIQRSSGKKHSDKCQSSHSKHHSKRSFLASIESRLEELLVGSSKTLKRLVYCLKQSFDLILMNEQEMTLRKIFLLLKEITEKVGAIAERYKNKYNRAQQKIHSLLRIHQSYIQKESIHTRSRSKAEHSELQKSNKKSQSVESIILNENYSLKKKIHQLQKELSYYSTQNASLNNVFYKFKNSENQQGVELLNGRDPQNFGSKNYQVFSNNKFQQRRSSQNILSNQQSNQLFSIGAEKRLSFDPVFFEGQTQAKTKQFSNHLYSSVGSSRFSDGRFEEKIQKDDENRPKNHQVKELSEEEDSQNQ